MAYYARTDSSGPLIPPNTLARLAETDHETGLAQTELIYLLSTKDMCVFQSN
jgi:hypothetical protein